MPIPRRVRLDRPMLVSNLTSGAAWLVIPLAFGAWPLSFIGAGYVVVGSFVLAASYGRGPLSTKQEIFVWIAPWLAAVALWAVLLSAPDIFAALWFGTVVATPCYLGWQAVALAIRQFMAWRRGIAVENGVLS